MAKHRLNDVIQDPELRQRLEKNFWSKVDVKENQKCWNWIAKARHPFGYGRISFTSGTQFKSHRISFALANGPIPEKMLICHRCDNPSCCNPDHLFLGTQKENMADAKIKGRTSPPPHSYGENHHNSKFSDEVSIRIKNDQRSARIIAEELNVNPMTIFRHRKKHGWKKV